MITDEQLKELSGEMDKRIAEIAKIDKIISLENDDILIPSRSTAEHRKIAKYAKTPWASNIIQARVNRLKVSGIVGDNASDKDAWGRWRTWGMPLKEKLVYKDTVSYGTGFIELTKSPAGKYLPVIKDPRRFVAFYGAGDFNDGLLDEFPRLAMERSLDGKKIRVWDDKNITIYRSGEGSGWAEVSSTPHGFPVVPIVRYVNDLTSAGDCLGDIHPVRFLLGRITKTTYDSLMINHSNSWKVKYIAGMSDVNNLPRAEGESDEEYRRRQARVEEAMRLELETSTILTSTNKDTKFGSLPETAPGGFVAVIERDLKELGAVTHTPSEYLTGDTVSQSAEQSSNSQQNYRAMIADKRSVMAEGHASMMRLYLLGEGKKTEEWHSVFVWEENDNGARGAIVDAALKMKALGVPKRAVWATLPNVSPEQLDEWLRLAEIEEQKELAATNALLAIGEPSKEVVAFDTAEMMNAVEEEASDG